MMPAMIFHFPAWYGVVGLKYILSANATRALILPALVNIHSVPARYVNVESYEYLCIIDT